MSTNLLAVLGVVAYVLAYVATWSGAEAAHISRLLATAPNHAETRCPHCRRPGIVRVGKSGVSAGISHRRWCPSHPSHARRPRHAF